MLTAKALTANLNNNRPYRIGISFPKDSVVATNFETVKKQLTAKHGQEVSATFIIAHLSAFYLRNHLDRESLTIPEGDKK